MNVVDSVAQMREARAVVTGLVGFVPTMGALHRGHASLIERARAECDEVVVSIFVNPTQFGPNEDLKRYPRTLESDIELCRQAGVSAVWTPHSEEIYPVGAETIVDLEVLGGKYEGESRPGHFRGVATVVTKLFNVVAPHRAYFGEKDLQQLFVIRRMVRDLLSPIEIVGVPIARESSGLALSSRNTYLEPSQRAQAAAIYKALSTLRKRYLEGCREAGRLREIFMTEIGQLEGSEVERFDLFNSSLTKRFEENDTVSSGYCAVVVRYSGVRLLDNIALCS